jgi:hypothetical protein
MPIMYQGLIRGFALIVALAAVLPAHATVNFSGLTGVELEQAQALDAKYSQFAQSFSRYYGDAMAFSSHLSAPIARDNLGKFPSLYVGIGMGASFGKVNAMKSEVDSSIQSSVPSYLAAPNISFNFGMGITRKWDLRFSFFPNVPIALSSGAFGSNTSAEIKFGTYRARMGYHLVEGGFLKPGVTIAGFASYTTGALSVTQTGQSVTSGSVSLTNVSSSIATNWQYLGVGPEARVWYDLMFFHPFIGYSLGLQVGQYTTGLNITGDMVVGGYSGNGSIVISERQAARLLSHRLMLGFEISLFLVEIGVEAQVDMVNGLVGAALGTAFRF